MGLSCSGSSADAARMKKPLQISLVAVAAVLMTSVLVVNCGQGEIGGPPSSSQLGLSEDTKTSASKARTTARSENDNQVHVFLDRPHRDNPASALQKALYLNQLFDLDGEFDYRVHVDNQCLVTASQTRDAQGRELIVLAPQEVYLRSNKKNDYSKGFMCGRVGGRVPRDHTHLAELSGYTRVVVVAEPKSGQRCSPGKTDPCKYFHIYVGVGEYGEARVPYKRIGADKGTDNSTGHFVLRGPQRVVEGGMGEYELFHTRSDVYRLGEHELLDVDGRLGLFWDPSHSFHAAFQGDNACDPNHDDYGIADVCLELRGDGMQRLGTQGAPYLSYRQRPYFEANHSLFLHFENNRRRYFEDNEYKEHFFIGFDPHKSVHDPYRTYDRVRQAFRVQVFDSWQGLFKKTRFTFPSNKKINKTYKKWKKKPRYAKLGKPVLHNEVLCVTSASELINRQMTPALSSTGKPPYWYSLRSSASYDLTFDPYYLTILGQATTEQKDCRSGFHYYAVDAHFSWTQLNFYVARMDTCPAQKELQKLPKCAAP